MTAIPTRAGREKIGRVILAGGEILLGARARARALFRPRPSTSKIRLEVKLIVQTTGDLVTEKIVEELLAHHVWQISVSGIDHHHDGLETKEAQEKLVGKLTRIFESRGMEFKPLVAESAGKAEAEGRYFSFFGATEDDGSARCGRAGAPNKTKSRRRRCAILLQPLVGRAQFFAVPVSRLGSIRRAERQRLPLLHQDKGADRQSAR